MKEKQKNVLGEDLEECSNNPLTGWFTVMVVVTLMKMIMEFTQLCAKVTTEFLEWLKVAGNDLITPHPEFGFPGLKRWRWMVRYVLAGMQKLLRAEKACPIFLEKNPSKYLEICSN